MDIFLIYSLGMIFAATLTTKTYMFSSFAQHERDAVAAFSSLFSWATVGVFILRTLFKPSFW